MIGSCWAVFCALDLRLPNTKHPVLFYSNHTRDDLSRLYHKAIVRAKKSIDLSIYSLTDPHLIALLTDRADHGVSVILTYDEKATGSLPTPLKTKCTTHPHTGRGLMHRKLLIIDDKTLFIGSANLTPTSLKMHDNFVIGIRNKKLAKQALSKPSSKLTNSDQSGTLWLLPEANPCALESLIERIGESKSEIHIALFTLTHPSLVEALIAAHQRGVLVSCVLDHYTAEGASRKAQERLREAGANVYFSRGQQLFHHKWALIDNSTLFSGSANWTRAAFSINADCLMELENLSASQRKFMHKMWKTIQSESIQPPMQASF